MIYQSLNFNDASFFDITQVYLEVRRNNRLSSPSLHHSCSQRTYCWTELNFNVLRIFQDNVAFDN